MTTFSSSSSSSSSSHPTKELLDKATIQSKFEQTLVNECTKIIASIYKVEIPDGAMLTPNLIKLLVQTRKFMKEKKKEDNDFDEINAIIEWCQLVETIRNDNAKALTTCGMLSTIDENSTPKEKLAVMESLKKVYDGELNKTESDGSITRSKNKKPKNEKKSKE